MGTTRHRLETFIHYQTDRILYLFPYRTGLCPKQYFRIYHFWDYRYLESFKKIWISNIYEPLVSQISVVSVDLSIHS